MDTSDQVLIALRQIVRNISLRSKKLMQTCGLSTPQLLVMREIASEGEIASGLLSSRVSLSPATVTSILDRLVAKNLVSRIRSDIDRRKVLVRLTESGAQKLKEAPNLLQEQFTERFNQLADWEQTAILSTLQRVAKMMSAQDLPASPVLTADEI